MFDDLTTGHEWAVDWVPLVRGSTGDRDLVRSVLADYQPEAVVHFAANAYVGESMLNPANFHNSVVNALGLLNVLIEDGVRPFVFSSTYATYGIPSEAIPETEELRARVGAGGIEVGHVDQVVQGSPVCEPHDDEYRRGGEREQASTHDRPGPPPGHAPMCGQVGQGHEQQGGVEGLVERADSHARGGDPDPPR